MLGCGVGYKLAGMLMAKMGSKSRTIVRVGWAERARDPRYAGMADRWGLGIPIPPKRWKIRRKAIVVWGCAGIVGSLMWLRSWERSSLGSLDVRQRATLLASARSIFLAGPWVKCGGVTRSRWVAREETKSDVGK